MSEEFVSYKKADGSFDRDALNFDLRYLHFGSRLQNACIRKGLKPSAVAEFVGIERREFSLYTSGAKLPDLILLAKMAKVIGIPLQMMMRWADGAKQQASRKYSEQPVIQRALKYDKDWLQAVEKFYAVYKENYSVEEIPTGIKRVMANLEGAIKKTFKIPVLPMTFYMVTSTLAENKKASYLHEIPDFVLDGEHFGGWLARDVYFGLFIKFAANHIFFQDNPSSSVQDCFNRLRVDQFKVLFMISLYPSGIYGFSQNVAELQQYHEFASLGALMADKLKPFLPSTVNFDHLYASVLAQSASIHAFYTFIKPALLEDEQNSDKTKKSSPYEVLNEEIADLISFTMHPTMAGLIAANWDYPEPVVRCLIAHHEPAIDAQGNPNPEVNPLTAALKLINYFVDCNFPSLQGGELTELMKKYPQISIPEEKLFRVVEEMSKLKEYLVERSSSMVESRSSQVSKVTSKRTKQFLDKTKTQFEYNTVVMMNKPKSSEFRFDPEYQQALINESYQLYVSFLMEMILLKKDEKLAAYEKRMGDFLLAFHYTGCNTMVELINELGTDEEVLKQRLLGLKTT